MGHFGRSRTICRTVDFAKSGHDLGLMPRWQLSFVRFLKPDVRQATPYRTSALANLVSEVAEG